MRSASSPKPQDLRTLDSDHHHHTPPNTHKIKLYYAYILQIYLTIYNVYDYIIPLLLLWLIFILLCLFYRTVEERLEQLDFIGSKDGYCMFVVHLT